jgi:hypothetical protein
LIRPILGPQETDPVLVIDVHAALAIPIT